MANFDLQKILEAWMLATGEEKKDFDKIRIGIESDWLCHKAKNLMQTDPTGTLSAFAMRAAYNKFIKEHSFTLEDIINGAWDEIKTAWADLYNQLYVENAGPIINDTQKKIIDIINKLGEDITKEQLQENDFETVFVDAFDNFKRFNIDTFKHPHSLDNVDNPRVCGKLFFFEHYKQFIDALRSSSEDNIIVVSLIDRTNETVETEYDEKFDKFFAFGVKRNGGIVVVSDRVSYSSPSHARKTRNPSRDHYNKIEFDHLPYCNLDEIMSNTEKTTQLLLPSPDHTAKFKFCEGFDIEGYIYIATLLSIIYDKFFKGSDNWDKDCLYFSSEIKFITAAQSTDIVEVNEHSVVLPESNVTAVGYKGTEDAYNHGLFDHYIDRFPVTETLPVPTNVLATKEDMEKQAWWAVRNAQREAVLKGLSDSYHSGRRHEVATFVSNHIYENLDKIIEYAFTTDDSKPFCDYNVSDLRLHEEDDRPVLHKLYGEHADIPAIQIKSIQYGRESDWFKPSRWHNDDWRSYDDMIIDISDGSVSAWWMGDKNRSITMKVFLRTYTDLVKFLGLSSTKDLPIELQHYLYTRYDMWSRLSWAPYRGNSILSFTDPMNDIEDPWNELALGVVFYLSKTKYNEMIKKYGNKRNRSVEQYDYNR